MKENKGRINEIITLMRQNGGILTGREASERGLSRTFLPYLAKHGRVERTGRGVYQLPTVWQDPLWLLQHRFQRGIFSLSTALYLLGLSDRTPEQYDMTFPSSYNASAAKKEGVKCSFSSPSLYGLGIVSVQTAWGKPVLAYCAERTLCELLRKRAHADPQLVSTAFRRYVSRPGADVSLLLSFASQFHVERLAQSYLEVLL